MMSTRRLSRLALVATLVLVAIGGFTRGSGSGFGCADRWPLCENGLLGGLLPRPEYNMVVEWTHRWVAAIVGILALASAVTAWRRHRYQRRIVTPAIAAVAAIGVQAWVGRLVVKGELDADLVSVHLTISMVVVALLTMVVVGTAPEALRVAPADGGDRAWFRLLTVAATGSLVLSLLGSYVNSRYVSGWPLVGNSLFPDLSNRFVAVHYVHRVVAAAGLVYLGYLAIAATRRSRSTLECLLVYSAGAVYVLNIGLGAAQVFTRVGSSVLVAGHLVMASLVWALLVAGATIARYRALASEESVAVAAISLTTPG